MEYYCTLYIESLEQNPIKAKLKGLPHVCHGLLICHHWGKGTIYRKICILWANPLN